MLSAQNERMLKPGETFWECVKTEVDYSKYCPEMVVVPAGTFLMGSSKAKENESKFLKGSQQQHEVMIARPLAVSKFEVTYDQWDACIQYGSCTPVESPFGRGKLPVININWRDAQQYVTWLSERTGRQYRLLSETEWEYSARAGTTGPYSFGADETLLEGYAWYAKNSGNRTHRVGEKNPNGFGLYDMHGNVWEWVEDCEHEAENTLWPPSDGSAWRADECREHIVRGGGWLDDPPGLLSVARAKTTTDDRYYTLGFRVARTLSAPSAAITAPLVEH